MMFNLSHHDINIAQLRDAQLVDTSGGFVSFEGWVRNHNLGRSVTGLHYDAYEPLAVHEGNLIITEALEKFDIRTARCQHRVGALAIGGIAVWIGVGANHRDASFVACRYIIDQVKARVPIWKKELYTAGAAEWVDCRDL